MGSTGRVDVEDLLARIEAREIDTVLVAFCDLQGRLVGKRVTGRFFRDRVVADGIDACSYLLAVDVDMTPVPGYQFASWERGYGDFACRPDFSTLRILPWLDRTALVLCDLFDEHSGEPVAVSPRQILRAQLARARPHAPDLRRPRRARPGTPRAPPGVCLRAAS